MVREVEAKLKGQLKLGPGSKVQINGLKNQKELNGLTGHLLQFDPAKLRWGVKLADGKQVALKMDNLLPVDLDVIKPDDAGYTPPPATPCVESSGTSVDDSTRDRTDEASATSPEQTAEGTTCDTAASPAAADVGEASTPTPGPAIEAKSKDEIEVLANDDDWPVLPTSAATQAKMQSGCWFDGGSAAKRFTEKLHANDKDLVSVCLVPPKRFDDCDVVQICDALKDNSFCTELVASGHPLSSESCELLAQMIGANKVLQILSLGESSLGDGASILAKGLAKNTSLTSLDLEHKGLTTAACKDIAQALADRGALDAAPLVFLKLSRNTAVTGSLSDFAAGPAPAELLLCECALRAEDGVTIGRWVAQGMSKLDVRDNSSWGGEGLENLMTTLLPKTVQTAPSLRSLRLDGCAIGDDGMEVIADACGRGLQLEHLFVERCEITKDGCEMLARGLRGERLHTLSARANVIGDEGCTLLGRCADRLDLSSTSLSGQVLAELGQQPLVSLELFSNPSLGPSVASWWDGLDQSQWQRLEHLDLSGCDMKDEGFERITKALLEKPQLMPALSFLCLGANSLKEDDAKCVRVEELGSARNGKLKVVWQSS